MANSPPSTYVYDFATNREVRILLPTQALDPTAVGQPLGTGTGNVAGTSAASTNSRVQNRVVAFGDDLYCLGGSANSTTFGGIYKRNQSGTDQWGQVLGISFAGDNHSTGLFVLHPGGVPTLVCLYIGGGFNFYSAESTDGTSWTTNNHGFPSGGNESGQAITFRDSLFWSLDHNAAYLFGYDFSLGAPTNYLATNFFISANPGNIYGIHVQDNTLFMCGWRSPDSINRIVKLQAGSLITILDGVGSQEGMFTNGHNCMFTDPTTGDLIVFWSGRNSSGAAPRTLVQHIENATTTATPVNDISSTVLGSGEGADKYLQGGGSADNVRSWYAYVDNDTVPTSPRVFLKTFGANGITELWEWKGVGAEVELVGAGAGIDVDQFSVNSVAGGGTRSSGGGARAELGDTANTPEEVVGGTKHYFRVYGAGGPVVMTLYYSQSEEAPDKIATLVGAVTVESGSPSTTPSRSGNTIINLTADGGTALYSFVHDATTDGLGEGATFTLMPDVV